MTEQIVAVADQVLFHSQVDLSRVLSEDHPVPLFEVPMG